MKPERIWVLLAKKKAGEANQEELEELSDLLSADSNSGYSSEIIDRIWEVPMHASIDQSTPDDVWNRIELKTGQGKKKGLLRFISTRKWAIAACVLAIVSVAGAAAYFYATDSSSTNTLHANLSQVTTQPGSKSKLELPDGTKVWLNGSSKLTYANGSFGKSNREVVLTGEAFFDVVKNEQVPFIIHTGNVNITVKGTAFNVKAYPRDSTIETSLVRGLVEITTREDPDRKILLKPNEKITIPVIPAGKIVSKRKDSLGTSLYSITRLGQDSEAPPELAWTNAQLIFDNESFAMIAPKLESWYNIKIRFTDEALKGRKFSGVIEKETLSETLEAMKLSWNFNYSIRENQLTVGNP